jgi:iron complex outermembrane receptor protein
MEVQSMRKPSRLLTLPIILMASVALGAVPEVQAANEPALEEVIVTAQHKAESLQDTPISLAVFNSEDMEKAGIAGLGDLKVAVPGMTMEAFPLNNQTLRVFIRGIGLLDAQITQDPAIGIYLDGIYIARSTGLAFDVAELERIEVLRGPQGTLYGRNATGGTVNIITRRPQFDDIGFKQTLTGGSRNLMTSKTALNLPLSSSLAIRLSYLSTQQDGFVENTGPGGDFGDRSAIAQRFDLRWDTTDQLQINYNYENSDTEFYNYTLQPIRPKTISPSSTPAGIINNQVSENSSRYFNYPGDDVRFDALSTQTELLPSNTKIEGHTFTAEYIFGESVSIKYLLGHRSMEDKSFPDLGGGSSSPEFRLDGGAYTSKDGSLSTPAGRVELNHRQTSHEIQLAGSAFNDRLDIIAGLYTFDEEARERQPSHHVLNAPVSIVEGPLATTIISALLIDSTGFDVRNKAHAVFTQANWNPRVLDDRLEFTLGLRYSKDNRFTRRYRQQQMYLETETVNRETGAAVAGPPTAAGPAIDFDVSSKKPFTDTSSTLVAAYRLSDSSKLYVKYAQAYKSGGFNAREPDPQQFVRGFDAEYVASYELGIKSELLNRRLRFNANVFETDFTNRQMNFKIDGTITDTRVFNAGESRMQGAEVDLTLMVTHDLILTAGYAWLDARMIEVINPDTGEDTTDEFTFFSAPKHSFNARLDYSPVTFSWGRLNLNLSYSYKAETNGANKTASIPNTRTDALGLFNARVGIYDIPVLKGQLTAAAWAKNLTDEEYATVTMDFLPQADRAVMWGEPRTVGLDIIYRY